MCHSVDISEYSGNTIKWNFKSLHNCQKYELSFLYTIFPGKFRKTWKPENYTVFSCITYGIARVFPKRCFSFLLISDDRCNRFFWDIRLKFYLLSNLNMLFWFLLTTFHRTNKLFLCLQKVDHVTNYCKRRIQSNFIVNISLGPVVRRPISA